MAIKREKYFKTVLAEDFSKIDLLARACPLMLR